MKIKKRGYLLLSQIFIIFVLVVLFSKTSSALGISPAKVDINFQPGGEYTLTYNVFGTSGRELEVYAKGEMAKYVKLDKNKIIGSGEFTVILELPDSIEVPGQHVIYIGAREKIDEELAKMIGTLVSVNAGLIIHVPYPGKYLDVSLNSHNANVGEPIKFELELISQGDENITTTPKINILSQDKILETLFFKQREIASQEKLKLKKFFDTTNHNPGKYKAIAVVNYGGKKPATAESDFRIGELIINLVNHTKQIILDEKIKSFDIEIESGWNDNIEGVYADVSMFNGSKIMADFKTTSTGLTPWQKKTITGYFDTTNFTQGVYNANITLVYYGEDTGKSSSELVKVEFIEKPFNMILVVYIVAGLIVLIVIIFLIKRFLFKRKK